MGKEKRVLGAEKRVKRLSELTEAGLCYLLGQRTKKKPSKTIEDQLLGAEPIELKIPRSCTMGGVKSNFLGHSSPPNNDILEADRRPTKKKDGRGNAGTGPEFLPGKSHNEKRMGGKTGEKLVPGRK